MARHDGPWPASRLASAHRLLDLTAERIEVAFDGAVMAGICAALRRTRPPLVL